MKHGGVRTIKMKHHNKKGDAIQALNDDLVILKTKLGSESGFLKEKTDAKDQELKALLQEVQNLKALAEYDPLTDLPNRHQFRKVFQNSVEDIERHQAQCALLFVDLDHFKLINDNHGYDIGDKLLQIVAQRFSSSLRDDVFLARISGDEFMVILSDVESRESTNQVAKRLIDSLEQDILIDNLHLSITASIGIAAYPITTENPEKLFQHADIALYRAKEKGRNQFQYFENTLDEAHQRKLLIKNALPYAIDNHELELHYQPIFKLSDESLFGVEVLVRWNHPDLGVVSPSEFIPYAEEHGLIGAIGYWVIERAFEESVQWKRRRMPLALMGINLSLKQLLDRAFIARLRNMMEYYDVATKQIVFDVSERALMSRKSKTLDQALDSLHRAGFQIAIDDFGTGYSSLLRLKELAVQLIKIDVSFVQNIAANRDNALVIETIIRLAKMLNQAVVAEGIETEEQLELLKAAGCTYGQGYYFSKPLSAEGLVKFLMDKE